MVNEAKKEVIKRPVLTAEQRAEILTNKARIDIVKKHKLDENNFHYHWANSNGINGSNIDKYEKVGYDICRDEENNPITRTGQVVGVKQYLMRIPIDLFKEIQHYKLNEVRDVERSMGKKGNKELPSQYMYGNVTSTTEVIK